MTEEVDQRDLFAALERLSRDQIIEFIEQLQNSVDTSEDRNDSLTVRVDKLESDREILRNRLQSARDQMDRLKSNPFGRVASRITASSESPEPRAQVDEIESTPRASGLRVATILDEISDTCWSPEFDSIRLSRRTWRDQLESSSPDVLFVESAFSGVDGSWSRRLAHFGGPHDDVRDLASVCRDLDIPTVFWNKEDPVNYPWFIGAASAFDHVFTVDSDQIPAYQHDLGHSRIHVLPFAAQPTLHYPPESDAARSRSVGFAGSYYARKHAGRRAQMDMVLAPALELGLDIYDRMVRANDPRFAWPIQFRSRIVGSVRYPEMGDVYRRYKVFLNINTVTDSPTMCARRVFELAATGTPVVSGPSRALETMVPPGIASIVTSASETRAAIRDLLDDPQSRESASEAGPQWIAESHTYAHRFEAIVGTI